MLTPSIGFCAMPFDHRSAPGPRGLEDRRHDVDDVVELGADAARVLDAVGPGDAMPCRVPPKCEATCLVHLNGVSNAQDQATDMCGVVTSEPQTS